MTAGPAPRVAMTGPDGDRGRLGAELRRMGVATVGAPLLEAGPPSDPGPLRAAAARIGAFDAVVLASRRGADALHAALVEAGTEASMPVVATVGPGTSRRCAELGWIDAADDESAAVRAAERGGGAAALLADIDAQGEEEFPVRGRRFLLPAQEDGLPDLEEGLRARGAVVERVAAYALRPARDATARVATLRGGDLAAALVASPSAAAILAVHAAGGPFPPLVALGATTGEVLRALGLPCASVAPSPTAAGVHGALAGILRLPR
jgi:uroporphyrinogen-III synthase